MTDAPATRPDDDAVGTDNADDEDPALRGPIQGLGDLSEFLTEHPIDSRSFVRGLTVGIFVGAAIAGSAIWRRFRRSRRD